MDNPCETRNNRHGNANVKIFIELSRTTTLSEDYGETCYFKRPLHVSFEFRRTLE